MCLFSCLELWTFKYWGLLFLYIKLNYSFASSLEVSTFKNLLLLKIYLMHCGGNQSARWLCRAVVQSFYKGSLNMITARYKANATICQEKGRSVPRSFFWLSGARLGWREPGCHRGRSTRLRPGEKTCWEHPDQTWSFLTFLWRGKRNHPEPRGRAKPAPHGSS